MTGADTPRRRRERRGRGRRGPLLPQRAPRGAGPVRLPAWRSRADVFADLVHDAVRELHRRWAEQLGDLQVVVEDVPGQRDRAQGDASVGVVSDGAADGIALARTQPGRIVVYRRPIELRAEGAEELADLVHDVVVEAVADLLGLDPDEVDPDQG